MAASLGSHIMTPSSSTGKEAKSPQFPQGNTSLLLEKTKLGLRRSTPDSEALASSDDEQDPARHLARIASQTLPKPTQQPSWITSDSSRNVNQKSSTGTPGIGNEGHSPLPTPDANGWGSSGSPLARVSSNGNSYPWGNHIWSNDVGKPFPSRLAEIVPGSYADSEHGSNLDEPLRSPSFRRDSNAGGPIPFAIPLKPTLKAYRSQSYSVGQMEQDLNDAAQSRQTPYGYNGRTRSGTTYGGLQHRRSRPSMLGDYSHDNTVLEQLQEVEDDEESYGSSDLRHSTELQRPMYSETRSREQLERENALLRENNDLRQQLVNLSLTAQREGAPGLGDAPQGYNGGRRATFSDSVLEDPDEASLLGDDTVNAGHYAVPLSRAGRRMSEYGSGSIAHGSNSYLSNRAIDIVKRNHWQSSLGFGGLQDLPQSRRHSFADVPKRQVSLTSLGGDGPMERSAPMANNDRTYTNSPQYHQQQAHHIGSQEPAHQILPKPNAGMSMRSYGGQHGLPFANMANHIDSMYMVCFKLSRAELYYVPQGVGLEIKLGDLVIVEADRGTDLGTVVEENVQWEDARQLKEQYAREHHNLLMMYARRHNAATNAGAGGAGGVNSAGTSAAGVTGSIGSAIGGGPPRDQHPLTKEELEIKPKMIKRLAQPHEINNLKEKEASEAKAKRVCQTKADEHGLDMEILDAEFQTDWKKLTFYYYADSYINFNTLVSDLFKTYKTRIWMSAINPASFMTPGVAPSNAQSVALAMGGTGAILPYDDPRNLRGSGIGGGQLGGSMSAGAGGRVTMPNNREQPLQYYAAHPPQLQQAPAYASGYVPQESHGNGFGGYGASAGGGLGSGMTSPVGNPVGNPGLRGLGQNHGVRGRQQGYVREQTDPRLEGILGMGAIYGSMGGLESNANVTGGMHMNGGGASGFGRNGVF